MYQTVDITDRTALDLDHVFQTIRDDLMEADPMERQIGLLAVEAQLHSRICRRILLDDDSAEMRWLEFLEFIANDLAEMERPNLARVAA